MKATLLFLSGVGFQEILLIGLFVLVFFGAKKIPEFMEGLGKGVREFNLEFAVFWPDFHPHNNSGNFRYRTTVFRYLCTMDSLPPCNFSAYCYVFSAVR